MQKLLSGALMVMTAITMMGCKEPVPEAWQKIPDHPFLKVKIRKVGEIPYTLKSMFHESGAPPTAILLDNGLVFLISASKMMLFDPESEVYTKLPSIEPRRMLDTIAIKLKDGRVLIVGRWGRIDAREYRAYLFDPKNNTIKKIANPPEGFNARTTNVKLLSDGRVFIPFKNKLYLFDPKTETFNFWMPLLTTSHIVYSQATNDPPIVILNENEVIISDSAVKVDDNYVFVSELINIKEKTSQLYKAVRIFNEKEQLEYKRKTDSFMLENDYYRASNDEIIFPSPVSLFTYKLKLDNKIAKIIYSVNGEPYPVFSIVRLSEHEFLYVLGKYRHKKRVFQTFPRIYYYNAKQNKHYKVGEWDIELDDPAIAVISTRKVLFTSQRTGYHMSRFEFNKHGYMLELVGEEN